MHSYETTRLNLEPLVEAHATELFEPLCDPKLYEFIPTNPPESMSWLADRYERLSLRTSPDGNEQWLNWVIRVKDSRVPVGTVEVTIRQDETALLAYTVFASEWGMGYAREACGCVVRELFQNGHVKEFIAHVDTRNVRSIRLLESLKFSLVDTIVGADKFKGSVSDEFVFSFRNTKAEVQEVILSPHQ